MCPVKTRNNIKPVPIVSVGYPTGSFVRYSSGIGDYQYVDILPNKGKWRPGIFRLNNVIMRKGHGEATSGDITFNGLPSNPYMRVTGPILANGPDPIYGSSACWGVWDSQVADWTMAKAYEKIVANDLEVGVVLGELSETIKMLISPITGLRKYLAKKMAQDLRNAKRLGNRASRKLKRKASAWKKLGTGYNMSSDIWLQYRFGISPFLKDLDDAMKLCSRVALRQSSYIHKKTASFEKSWVRVSNPTFCNWTHFTYYQEEHTTFVLKGYTSIYYKILHDRSVSDYLGLTFEDSLSVIWELVPYSFVVDRFVGISTWLKGIKPAPWLASLGASQSQKTTAVLTRSHYAYTSIWGVKPQSDYSGNYTWTAQTLIRSLTNKPPAMPVTNPKALNFMQWVDHLYLATQRIKFKR